MSMHEIESLMEQTVRMIDASQTAPSEKRNSIWNVYQLQNQFDCSFTHFRLMDVLLKNDYVQLFDVDQFPMAKAYPDFFKALTDVSFEWIHKNPTKKWSDDNPEMAYWDKNSGKIYVDFGTAYYTLHPEERPSWVEPLTFGKQMIEEGNIQKNKEMVYDWAAFMIFYLLVYFPSDKTLEELKAAYFSEIKDIIQQYDFSNYTASHKGLDLSITNAEYLSDIQKELVNYMKSSIK